MIGKFIRVSQEYIENRQYNPIHNQPEPKYKGINKTIKELGFSAFMLYKAPRIINGDFDIGYWDKDPYTIYTFLMSHLFDTKIPNYVFGRSSIRRTMLLC